MKHDEAKKPIKVAIQGIEGSYHHFAAELYFGNRLDEMVLLNTFREVTRAVEEDEADYAVMAIENSIAGTILPNYSLLFKHDLQIIGEIYIPISHQLLAVPGVKLEQITQVHSHPMALLQCDDFLEMHPNIVPVESADTAMAAREIMNKQHIDRAAIASIKAAEVYNLNILASSIQTIKRNSTRFLILSKYGRASVENPNKASLRFRLRHESGSLQDVLTVFKKYAINMTKIQSIPVIESPWEYSFLVDVTWEDKQQYLDALQKVLRKVKQLQIFGEYLNGIDK